MLGPVALGLGGIVYNDRSKWQRRTVQLMALAKTEKEGERGREGEGERKGSAFQYPL